MVPKLETLKCLSLKVGDEKRAIFRRHVFGQFSDLKLDRDPDQPRLKPISRDQGGPGPGSQSHDKIPRIAPPDPATPTAVTTLWGAAGLKPVFSLVHGASFWRVSGKKKLEN